MGGSNGTRALVMVFVLAGDSLSLALSLFSFTRIQEEWV